MPSWVDRFAENLERYAGADAMRRLMEGREPLDAEDAAVRKARWIGTLMQDLESELDPKTVLYVLEATGRGCIGQSLLDTAGQMYEQADGMEQFLELLNRERIGGGHLRREGSLIRGHYDHCYCAWVNAVPGLVSSTFCYCSAGWLRELFESVLGEPVDVRFVQTVLGGGDRCEFIVTSPALAAA
ncbi:MAG: DUF6144 family protein [Candidatus Brocadiia bacterium]